MTDALSGSPFAARRDDDDRSPCPARRSRRDLMAMTHRTVRLVVRGET
jgi:hypothetical protein